MTAANPLNLPLGERSTPLCGSQLVAHIMTAGLLGLIVWIVYYTALSSPFIFDDVISVTANPSITRLWPLVGTAEAPGPFNPPSDLPTSGRPLVNASLAVNYRLGGFNPWGYHFFSIVVHFLSALLVMTVVERSLRSRYFLGKFDRAALPLAFLTAALWSVHPLQTETVVYVTQRTELMAGFFYLVTLYAGIRYWEANHLLGKRFWMVAASAACLAGMACKEMMATAPLVVLMYERTFVAGTFRKAAMRSWQLYAGLAISWLLLIFLNIDRPRAHSAGFDLGISAPEWWLMQTKVLLVDLRKIVWPWPILIHYEMPYFQTIGSAWPWVVGAALLLIATVFLFWRRSAVGFVAASAIVILSPTLVVPIVTEVTADRRMYLPLVGFAAAFVAGVYRLLTLAQQRLGIEAASTRRPLVATAILVGIVTGLFGVATARRADAFHEPLKLWKEAIEHDPHDAIAQNNLANSLLENGNSDEALDHYRQALDIQPDYAVARVNFGYLLDSLGRIDEAIANFNEVLRLNPDEPSALFNLGAALNQQAKYAEAKVQFEKLLQVAPAFPWARYNLGNSLLNLGDLDDARQQYELQLAQRPDLPEVHNNLGIVLSKLGQKERAIAEFREAVRLRPTYTAAWQNLGALQSELRQAVPSD